MNKLMKKSIVGFSMTTLLTACVMPHHTEPRWYKEGVTNTEAEDKYASCVYNVGMNKVEVTQNQTLIEACMKADGFRWGVPPHLRPDARTTTNDVVEKSMAIEQLDTKPAKKSVKKGK